MSTQQENNQTARKVLSFGNHIIILDIPGENTKVLYSYFLFEVDFFGN